ncbi:Ubiquitin carboxyl-terminal hydrolase 10, partial [Exophiala xenobiotica]
MSKRKSVEPLEDVLADASPLSKKARVEDIPEEELPTANSASENGTSHDAVAPVQPNKSNGAGEEEEEVESDVEDDRFPAAPARQ